MIGESNIANIVNDCEVCGESALPTVLDLGLHPLCDDLVPIGSGRSSREYPIQILWCGKCGTAHQKYQIPRSNLFPLTYHYRARFTANVLNGMHDLVESCIAHLGSLKGKLVLDVGCNDGSLLNAFRAKGAITLGVEPTGAYADASSSGHNIVNDFFTPSTAASLAANFGKPDIITFTNVFAHIENLPELVDALRVVSSSETTLVIENHYLGSILDKGQFDTFYHEHPRTYSLNSFRYIARQLGLRITEFTFPERYGGNIRVFMGRGNGIEENLVDLAIREKISREVSFGERLVSLHAAIAEWRLKKRRLIDELVSLHGPLPSKSFPGRAAILITLLGLSEREISACYEKPGSMKIGYCIPGTTVQICSDEEIPLEAPVLINFAWHISDEIRSYLRSLGFRGEIHNIFSPDEL